jgi:two-component system, NarL family, sensor histidine kinase UhpB
MWRKVSLRYRLNLLFGALLLVWLVGDVGRMLMQAGPRARAESESAIRLTSEFVTTALTHLQDSPEPARDLDALAANLQNLRHVRVGLVSNPAPALVSAFVAASQASAPEWFRAIVQAPISLVTIPVVLKQRRLGSLLIVADPSDEIDEVWSTVENEAIAGGALTLAVLMASSLLIGRALKPLGLAGMALARLASGDYSARVEPSGSPEFVDTCRKINSLAEALSDLHATNGRLIERLLDVQDAERKTIAHELHDEIGPHLFALRAKAAVLGARLQKGGDADAAAAAISIRDQVEALQEHNRRILVRLRPAALEELGLIEALQALVEQWRKDEPNVALTFSAPARVAELGERASLMAYRFVQEALTNAFRHSRARHIDVTLAYDAAGGAANVREPALAGLSIRICDDGCGVAADASPGMGILGMRERVRALGGGVAIGAAPNGGAIVEATFTATRPFESDREIIPTFPGIAPDRFANN